MKETDIQNAICEYLALKKHFFWRSNNIPAFSKNPNGSMRMHRMPKYSRNGVPDIIVIKDGFFIGLEVKIPKGKQSENQKIFERELKEAGGEYIVVHSIEDVQEIGL